MLRAGVVAGAGGVAACLGAPPASAAPAARFSDDFTALRDGPLDGRVAPTGHRWKSFGAGNGSAAGTDPPLVVRGGAIGPPAGHVPGASGGPTDPNPHAAAGYGVIDLGGPAWRFNAQWRGGRATSSTTALAFGAFDFGVGSGFPNLIGGANAHLAVTPTYMQFAVFSMGVAADYEVLTPMGGSSGTVSFRSGTQLRDGRSVYRGYITINGDTARIDMDGLGPPVTYRDPRIATVKANNPFWEYYSVTGGTNLPRFVRVSAERA